MPNLVAYDLAGVQPNEFPTGLIFAMRSRKGSQTGDETFFDEVDTAFSGQNDGNILTQGWLHRRASDGDTTLVSVLLHQGGCRQTILEHLTHHPTSTQCICSWSRFQ